MNGQLQRNQNFWKWLKESISLRALIGVSFVMGVGLVALWSWHRNRDGVVPYRPSDRAVLEAMFRADEYLLLDERSTHFSLEHMFDAMAPSYDYPDGSLSIMVYRENRIPRGFVTYHRKTVLEARIQFLLVDQESRGKGYGRQLLMHAIEAVRSAGFQYVVISVRAENTRAYQLYRSVGFEEVSRSADGFVQLVKPLHTHAGAEVPAAEW